MFPYYPFHHVLRPDRIKSILYRVYCFMQAMSIHRSRVRNIVTLQYTLHQDPSRSIAQISTTVSVIRTRTPLVDSKNAPRMNDSIPHYHHKQHFPTPNPPDNAVVVQSAESKRAPVASRRFQNTACQKNHIDVRGPAAIYP